MKITLCSSCDLGQSDFGARLSSALENAGIAAEIATTDCMSGCARASTIAFRDVGKTAYMFGDITQEDLADLLTFANLYRSAPDGNLTDARPLGALRGKAIARIPA